MLDVLFLNSTESPDMKMQVNGTMLLATKLLHSGFSVNILRFYEIDCYKQDYHGFIQNAVETILDENPKCLSCYTLWPYFHIMLRITYEVKKQRPEIIIVMGGPQSSFSARETLETMPFVDYVCTGEGEETVIPFFDGLIRKKEFCPGEIPGLYYREKGIPVSSGIEPPLADMETLPYWDNRVCPGAGEAFSTRMTSKSYYMTLDVGRGCPFDCSFCCTSKFLHRYHRLKSPERIVADIRYYNEKFGIRSFQFSHDAFTTNKKLVTAFCDRLLESGMDITWVCCSRIDLLTEELVLKMKQAGMVQIDLGLETGSERMQRLTNKRLNLVKAKKMISFLLQNKIKVSLFFMYGFPEETEEDLAKTLELLFWALDKGVKHTSMAYCRFYPGAKITRDYFEELKWNPEAKKLARGIFGYKEEQQLFLENKEIFPFFYDLETTVRKDYHYMYFLGHMYRHLPLSMRYIRSLFEGDDLRFYREFYESNRQVFDKEIAEIVRITEENPLDMLNRLLDRFQEPYIAQLRGLVEFDCTRRTVVQSKEDMKVDKTYDFSYIDYKLNLPIDRFSNGRTRIVIEKFSNTAKMKILKIE